MPTYIPTPDDYSHNLPGVILKAFDGWSFCREKAAQHPIGSVEREHYCGRMHAYSTVIRHSTGEFADEWDRENLTSFLRANF